MKLELVRIYSEEELNDKLRQTEVLLRKLEQETTDHSFCDTPALKELWVKFEATRYIVAESLLLDDRYCRDAAQSLFVERYVDNDYTDELKDEAAIHNKLIALQFRFDSLFSSQKYKTYYIDKSMYVDNHQAIVEIATDIYSHLDISNEDDSQKIEDIVTWLNYIYLYEDKWDEVDMNEIVLNYILKEEQRNELISTLKSRLNLIEDTAL